MGTTRSNMEYELLEEIVLTLRVMLGVLVLIGIRLLFL